MILAVALAVPLTVQSQSELHAFPTGLERSLHGTLHGLIWEDPVLEGIPKTSGVSEEPRQGYLLVRVQLAGERGAPPAEGRPVPGPIIYGPLAGAPVRAIPAGTPGAGSLEQAEDITDARGEARFTLDPAEYWVYVPARGDISGRPGARAAGGNLPDGEPVAAWSPAKVGEQETAEVTLTVVIPLP